MKKRRDSPKEYLFVDGYNIINYWDELREKAEISLEEARESLIDILAEYHHYSGIEIIVVFDAHLVKGNSGTEEEYKGIKVVYTKESETADHYIERTLDILGRVKKIRVATSDWLEQQIILSRGGMRISARELEIEIYNQRDMINRKNDYVNKKNETELGKLEDILSDKFDKWNKFNK